MSFNGDLYPEAGASKVITTKGDLVRGNASGDRERYGIGSTNQILQVKSGTVSWETLSTAGSILTTQGDILYEDASGLARLGFGTSGDVLTTKGTGANPVWETPTGATTAIQRIVLSSSFNTSSSSFTDVTGMTVTLPDNSGHSFLSFQISCDMNVGTGSMAFRLVDDTTNLAGISLSIATSAIAHIVVYP